MAGAFEPPRLERSRFRLDGHRGEAKFADLLKWQMSGSRAKWPQHLANRTYAPPPERVDGKAMVATWIGQSTVLVQAAGLNILTDPFLSERASPLSFAGPRRVRPPGLTVETLPEIDLILLSHNHYDHMDLPSLRQLAKRHRAALVTPLGNGAYVRRAIGAMPVTELNWGAATVHGKARITVTPALHWSKRSMRDTNRALWGAFAVETAAGLIYFAGDTGFGEGETFRAVRRHFGPARLSLLPIGAYEPRWFMKAQHMNPEEAVHAHQHLESGTSLAIHHSTIQLTDEPLDEPKQLLRQVLSLNNLPETSFIAPDVGEPVEIG